MKKPKIAVVVSIGKNNVIGHGNDLVWDIPEDRKRFKQLTLGHVVIMGRKTFESILSYIHKPLPGRTNIVITRNPDFKYEGVLVFHSLEDALKKAEEIESLNENPEIHIGGGAELYMQAMPLVDKLYLTIVDGEFEGDASFPDYSMFKKVLHEEKRESNGYTYTFIDLER
jgi:dihydrofolate reductase